jgi:hypothetical protein
VSDADLILLAFRVLVELDVDRDELRGPIRRSVLLAAAGGDPTRDPELDGRAVTALAADLPDGLVDSFAAALPASGEPLAETLLADGDLARRALAAALLADELSD